MSKVRSFAKIWITISAALTLSSCSFSLSQKEKEENIISAPLIGESVATALGSDAFYEGTWPDKMWWKAYGFDELNCLIDEALTQNPTLMAAQARITQAKEKSVIARSKLFPLVTFNASDQWEYLSQNGLYRTLNETIPLSSQLIDFSLGYAYEFDFWGKYRNLFRASIRKEQAALAERAQVELIITTALAQAYFALKTNLLRKELYEELYTTRNQYFKLQKDLLKNSLSNKLHPLLSEESVLQAEQFLSDIEREIDMGKHLVNILAGRGPDTPLLLAESLPPLPQKLALPKEISLHLLARRPDLMAQIWRIDALSHEVGAAKAEFWPDVNLSGLLGFQSGSWSTLFSWLSKTITALPALNLPVYTAGAIKANVGVKKAEFDEAVYNYNELILQSFQQVTDTLTIGKTIASEMELQLNIVDRAVDRLALTEERVKWGIDTALIAYKYLEEVIEKDLEKTHFLYEQYLVSINLTKALGGGYLSCEEIAHE